MRSNYLKETLKTAVLAVTILLLGVGVSVAQQQVNLTAGPTTLTMPDGSSVPMWGYSCGAAVTTPTPSLATCLNLNPYAPAATTTTPAGWSPVVITVPTTATGGLTINLTNSLTFGANSVPTSLVIVGQLGGGLGTTATTVASPDHSLAQQVTWPIASPGVAANTPPTQGPRVQSFSTEVAAGATTALTWATLKPGTYLIESGTHPSIQGPMGLYGILVVTTAPAGATAGTAYPAVGTTPAVTYGAEIPLLFSEIDPIQNNAVQTAVNTTGFTETAVWSGQPGGCGVPTVHTCYPPAVNYTPLYYLINGVAFDKTNVSNSLFAATPATGVTGSVLVRMVNAGLRMHVPSIVGSITTPAVVPTSVTAAPVSGFSLVAEDGNPLPGVSRVQSEVFMPAGKTYDVMMNVPATTTTSLPVYDRELSLSGNRTARDAGMLAYIGINGTTSPAASGLGIAVARPDTYNAVVTGNTLTVSDPSKGVIANDTNVYGVTLIGTVAGLTLNRDGTFTYTGPPTSFSYCANGTVTGTCSSGITATVALNAATLEAASGITVGNDAYKSNVSTSISIAPPGVLVNDKDAAGYPLTVDTTTVPTTLGGGTLSMDASGAFAVSGVTTPGTYTFTYKAKNSQGTTSTASATVSVTFPAASGLVVSVVDGKDKTTAVTDYRWIIEEDRTFYVDPNCTANPPAAGCPTVSIPGIAGSGIVPTFGTNFHTSYMPVVAAGCVGPTGAVACESGQTLLNQPAVCDIGNGVCRTTASQQASLSPAQVALDPRKHYYISVLPGDAANSFENLNSCLGNATPSCGHGMGGAPILPTCTTTGTTTTCTFSPVTILVQPNPFPPSKLSVFVFEDDFPLNGEQDGGGGIDVLSPNEPGLGGFNITLFDDAGGSGDATGQMTYDMFNQPLSNSLSGTPDPANGNQDACPISVNAGTALHASDNTPGAASPTGITGTIVTCPKYEADGKTLSPLAGQAVVANLMPGRYGVVATPAADRIGRGEEWLQTNTLDGQKAHDSFLRIGEPSFFQEYGPAGYHVSIGFANPAIINSRLAGVCNGSDPNIGGPNCTNTVTGLVTTERMSRTPDERLYSSGDNSSFSFTQCYVSFGDPDGEDFAFTKCAADGSFSMSGLPNGDWRITVFDQWNDMLVDGLSTPVRLAGGPTDLGQIAMNQWQANIYTKTFFDVNGNGIQDTGEDGLTLLPTNIRFRDGSYSNFNNTDLSGNAGFNEIFPLFSWYVVESDTTRYKNTGVHVVYDAGGPADGTTGGGSSTIAANMANTTELVHVPTADRFPGSIYCANADCTGPASGRSHGLVNPSTGRIDPGWVTTEGWQGFSGQNSFIEFGKKPFVAGENGGIHGEVIYASTRPFDDPGLLIHTSWTPDVPGVTINLYQEGMAPDGVTTTLKLVDTTKTSSWDDWAQGFRSNGVPNMNCPGQGRDTGTNADLFFFTLYNQPMWLDLYNNVLHGTAASPAALPLNSQFKCFDGMHNWNQVQPAPYDGMYQFPSVTGRNLTSGAPTGTNCTGCVPNPTDSTPMLPAGKYVVEMIVPPGYELVKEEDKNILIGDNYIAPATQQFGGLGSVFILPDQAELSASIASGCDPTTSGYPCNPQQSTQNLGRSILPSHEGDTGSVETFWPCVGASRIVPDYISLFPLSGEVAPFAGATRNLCDRKEVALDDQTAALAKFWIFSSTHVAAHFTGVITDDFTSEFDPFSPQFGEKFSPANLPVAIKDWSGTEISRVYTDHWGTYDGLTYSTWEVNPPNPTGYAPTMMVTCMNDPGTGPAPDPLYNPQYSQFCYEIPFMPGQTQYMDTPVVPTSAFAGAGYNNPDCSYPNLTPAVKEVDGDGIGPWVSAAGHTLTITALGDQAVPNNGYSGPSAHTAPFNQKTITKHYGFGATAGTVALVGTDGVSHPLTSVTWGDLTITGTVPTGVPNCGMQQQALYGGSTAQCGQLVITASTGQQSIDTLTVTIGGQAPTHVAATATIQSAINAAKPGDLIIVDPTCTTTTGSVACTTAGAAKSQAAHYEMLLMWKPVRLQGVGAASSVINANAHPSGVLDTWRQNVNCLFGLAINGSPVGYSPSCGAGWFGFAPTANNPQIDRLPLEATVGWDASLNGNMAELLQEPSLMGALEGAAITVLSKGVFFPSSPFDPTLLAGFPTGTVLFTPSNTTTYCTGTYASNFWCNPSSIDGLGITDSSQGGGGIFVHGWGHNLQIANNRINNNAGTLSGGINVGQGEFPPSYIQGSATNAAPGSCRTSSTPNTELPYCHDLNVNVHNNAVTSNSSTGDELFSATPAGAGGVSFCTGSDFYKFNYNWVCGNLSTGDGGGLGHLGFSYNGDIEHNTFLFNQSTNPTIAANGGAMVIMGAPDVDPACGATTDQDCVSAPGSVGPSDGTGPGLVINANLIMGNAAESGSGGGIRFQSVNGAEVVAFPASPANWYSVNVTNNIIADNVAGWDGAGVSLQDALAVNFINNTVMSNDTTASSGVLFNTFGAPLASSSGPTCTANCGTSSAPQPAGLVSIQNSAVLTAALPATITCPAGHFAGTTANNGTCRSVSFPELYNDVFWQNRSFYIGVGSLGAGTLNQQHVVALYNAFVNTPAASEPVADATTANGGGVIITGGTGACFPGTNNFWDIGVRGDTGPTNHNSGVTLAPEASLLTNITGYPGGGAGFRTNVASNPTVLSQYCNGSRTPPEFKSSGYQVPPGISDATVPNPVFSLTPAATVDEGNNWINISWGPLALTNESTVAVSNTPLGNYGPAAGSPVINYVTPANSATTYAAAPSFDFFNNARKANNAVDAGAVEFAGGGATAGASVTGGPLAFGNVPISTTSASQNLTLHNTGTATLTGIGVAIPAPFGRITTGTFPAGAPNCGATLAAGANCTIKVAFSPTALGAATGSATITGSVTISGSPVLLTGTGVTQVVSASLAPPTRNFGTVTRGSLTGPLQVFTLTNTGNVTLTGIAQGALGGTDPTEFTIIRLLSTCGPAGGGQLLGQTTLGPGAACIVTLQFRPLTTQTTGVKNATVSVTDAAGTQTSTLTGTANP
jgi:hypothetical protein